MQNLVDKYLTQIYPRRDLSHDTDHVKRVINLAKMIYRGDKINVVVCAALLHDLYDSKYKDAKRVDVEAIYTDFSTTRQEVEPIVLSCSWSKRLQNPSLTVNSPEAHAVYDADLLDGLGAIGMARLFAYAGKKGNSMSDAMDHIDEKILKIKLFTEKGQLIAESRKKFTENFKNVLTTEIKLATC